MAKVRAGGPSPGDGEERGPVSDDGPLLSFACVCQAVAAELGLPVAEVRELGMTSVDEWRANFGPVEWQRVQERAVVLEKAKKAEQLTAEKDREKKTIAKITDRQTQKKSNSTPASVGLPSSGAKAKAKASSGKTAAGGKKAKKVAVINSAGLQNLATGNRFSNFQDLG